MKQNVCNLAQLPVTYTQHLVKCFNTDEQNNDKKQTDEAQVKHTASTMIYLSTVGLAVGATCGSGLGSSIIGTASGVAERAGGDSDAR